MNVWIENLLVYGGLAFLVLGLGIAGYDIHLRETDDVNCTKQYYMPQEAFIADDDCSQLRPNVYICEKKLAKE